MALTRDIVKNQQNGQRAITSITQNNRIAQEIVPVFQASLNGLVQQANRTQAHEDIQALNEYVMKLELFLQNKSAQTEAVHQNNEDVANSLRQCRNNADIALKKLNFNPQLTIQLNRCEFKAMKMNATHDFEFFVSELFALAEIYERPKLARMWAIIQRKLERLTQYDDPLTIESHSALLKEIEEQKPADQIQSLMHFSSTLDLKRSQIACAKKHLTMLNDLDPKQINDYQSKLEALEQNPNNKLLDNFINELKHAIACRLSMIEYGKLLAEGVQLEVQCKTLGEELKYLRFNPQYQSTVSELVNEIKSQDIGGSAPVKLELHKERLRKIKHYEQHLNKLHTLYLAHKDVYEEIYANQEKAFNLLEKYRRAYNMSHADVKLYRDKINSIAAKCRKIKNGSLLIDHLKKLELFVNVQSHANLQGWANDSYSESKDDDRNLMTSDLAQGTELVDMSQRERKRVFVTLDVEQASTHQAGFFSQLRSYLLGGTMQGAKVDDEVRLRRN